MAYGFNDDKSKVEVYSKNDFVILEGVITNVAAGGTGYKNYSRMELSSLGIYDISKWVPISIGQSRNASASAGEMVYSSPFGNVHSASSTYKYSYPYVDIESITINEALRVIVLNESESSRQDVTYRVVMMKIKDE